LGPGNTADSGITDESRQHQQAGASVIKLFSSITKAGTFCSTVQFL
jgi:hypothetical protein